MDESEEEVDPRIESLLRQRQSLTDDLLASPYDLVLYIKRALVYADLAYPDLAAGDAYRALLLTDEVRDESFEYHDQALDALTSYAHGPVLEVLDHGSLSGSQSRLPELEGGTKDITALAELASIRCYQILALGLLLCGCLRSASNFCERGLAIAPDNKELLNTRGYIQTVAERRTRKPISGLNDLPDWGMVRGKCIPGIATSRIGSRTSPWLS